MKHLTHALLFGTAIGALVACKKDDPAAVDLGYEYFPQNIGHWIEYQVDSTRVQLLAPPNTFDTTTYSYAIREVIVENITDGEGRPAQRILRYTRDTNNNWLPKDVWWQTRDDVRAERNEENRSQVKLVFPPRTTTEWDLNTANTEEAFGLTYEEVDVPLTLNGFSFDKTVTVVSTFENNSINTRNYRARYAKNVGLVGFEMDSINAQPDFNPNNPGFNAYERWLWKYTVTAYGN